MPDLGLNFPIYRKYHFLILALFFWGASLGVIMLFFLAGRTEYLNIYFLAVLLLALTVSPMVFSSIRRKFDVFEPIHLISIMIAVSFALRALYLVADFGQPLPVQIGPYFYQDFIPQALGYVILGYLALMGGYYLDFAVKFAKILPSLKLKWPTYAQPNKVALIFVIGLLAIFYQINQGKVAGADPAYSSQVAETTFIILSFLQFPLYAAGIAIIYIFRRQASFWLKLLFGCAIVPTVLAETFIFGGKSFVFLVIFATAAAYNYVRRRISLPQLIFGGIILAILIFPFVNTYRGEILAPIRGGGPGITEVIDDLGYTLDYISSSNFPSYFQRAIGMLSMRFHGIDSLALIIKFPSETKAFNFAFDYLLIPAYALVPRLFWPDKPLPHATGFGRAFVLPSDISSSSYTSFGMFHIGDLYINFGPLGIVIGMFILGIAYRLVYSYLKPASEPEPSRIFLYIFIIWCMVNGFEGEIAQLCSTLIKTVIFILGIAWLFKRRNSKYGNLLKKVQ